MVQYPRVAGSPWWRDWSKRVYVCARVTVCVLYWVKHACPEAPRLSFSGKVSQGKPLCRAGPSNQRSKFKFSENQIFAIIPIGNIDLTCNLIGIMELSSTILSKYVVAMGTEAKGHVVKCVFIVQFCVKISSLMTGPIFFKYGWTVPGWTFLFRSPQCHGWPLVT